MITLGKDKEIISLAGEYAVASEVCRRGYYAQVTYGKCKNVDILAVNLENGKSVLIEVKTKWGSVWPWIKGIKGSNKLLIFVDYQGKKDLERPDFYILDENDWMNFVQACVKRTPGLEIKGGYMPVWHDGKKGIPIRPKDITKYKEQWEKLIGKLEN